jgi:hypothetical protein
MKAERSSFPLGQAFFVFGIRLGVNRVDYQNARPPLSLHWWYDATKPAVILVALALVGIWIEFRNCPS